MDIQRSQTKLSQSAGSALRTDFVTLVLVITIFV